MAPSSQTSLDAVPPGRRCTIVELESNGAASPLDQRLLDLGFVPGTSVQVIRRAPLGDPSAYALRGFEVCLRRSEALRVAVRIEEP